jgi:hypothetical protein
LEREIAAVSREFCFKERLKKIIFPKCPFEVLRKTSAKAILIGIVLFLSCSLHLRVPFRKVTALSKMQENLLNTMSAG